MNVTWFSEPGSVEESGGKGYNLKRLTLAGFNVPQGIVIGASCYRDYYPSPPEFHFDNDQELEEQCFRMREMILGQGLPPGLEAAISEKLEQFDPAANYAVRSSSTFEDLDSAAFAGQHDTFLNIPLPGVCEAVKKCYASLWHPHAVLYRHHNDFDQQQTAMAVVVQCMLSSESSGVAFSVDPVSGILQHVLVEANFGLGESVVGGEYTTDSWVVHPEEELIIERRISRKKKKIVRDTTGIVEKEIPASSQDEPCLADTEVIRVGRLAKDVESAFGLPQDIEWSFVGDELFLLQARPQTKIPPRFTRDESAERFPEPLTPLTWSYVEEAFNISLEHSLALMGISLPTRPWFTLIDSYVYGNQNAVELLALNRPVDMTSFAALRRQLPELHDRFQWVIDLPNQWATDLDNYLLGLGRLAAVDFSSFASVEYQRYFQELFHLSCEYFRPNIAISMTQSFLIRTLFEYLGLLLEDRFEVQGVLKNLIADCGVKTAQVNGGLNKLAALARQDEKLLGLLGLGGKKFLEHIEQFEEFAGQFADFLQSYGHREISFDYYQPTWCEAPEVVLDLIHVMATADQEEQADKQKKLLGQRVEATHFVMENTPDDLRIFADELIRLTRQFSWLDDVEHFQTTRINVLVRKVIGSFGRYLGLADAYDLFFLNRAEIESIGGHTLSDHLIELIQTRKKEFFEAKKREPVWDLSRLDQQPTEAAAAIIGVPGSPGIQEGPVYLVHGAEDFAGMSANAVLVARTTNPSWTPLFYKCCALITESGGPLSHGAVTARELGIPAVMCVRGAMSRFQNGDHVRVDGLRGTVEVLTESGEKQ